MTESELPLQPLMNPPHPAHLILQIAIKAAWAPILVIIGRWLARIFHVREPLDHVIHFSGGLAIAYFLHQSIGICACYTGELRSLVRYVLTVTASCTVALFWEFGEFASDIFRGTHIQHQVSETLYDLIFGTLGATLTVVSIMLVKILRTRNSAGRKY